MREQEAQAEKMRAVVSGMRQELERLRAAPDGGGGGGGDGSGEVRALRSERAHLVAYNELLQQRCEELSRGVDGGSAAVEIRMLRARVKSLEEGAEVARAGSRGAAEAEVELGRLREELVSANRAVEAHRASAQAVGRLQGQVTELTTHLAAKSAECEGLRAERDGGGLTRELQAKLAAAETDASRLVHSQLA